MKLKHCVMPALALSLIVAPVSVAAQTAGQEQPQTQQPQPQPEPQQPRQPEQQPQQPTTQPRAEQPRAEERKADERRDTAAQQHEIVRADRVIGQTVRDRQDQNIGRINDLALNVKENRIAYAVVTRGGVWGIGGEDVAVSWKEIQPDQQARVVRLDEQRLQQARRIDTGQAWPMDIGQGPVGTAGAAPDHQMLPMSNVIGMDVHNKQGESLGRIDDVAIRHDGEIAYAVIAHGGFLGMGDNYVAIPWDKLTMDAQRQGAVVDVTRQQFEAAPRFEHRDRWPNRVDWQAGGGTTR